jgi:hypothetical protein
VGNNEETATATTTTESYDVSMVWSSLPPILDCFPPCAMWFLLSLWCT